MFGSGVSPQLAKSMNANHQRQLINLYPICSKLSANVAWHSAILVPLHDDGGAPAKAQRDPVEPRNVGVEKTVPDVYFPVEALVVCQSARIHVDGRSSVITYLSCSYRVYFLLRQRSKQFYRHLSPPPP